MKIVSEDGLFMKIIYDIGDIRLWLSQDGEGGITKCLPILRMVVDGLSEAGWVNLKLWTFT